MVQTQESLCVQHQGLGLILEAPGEPVSLSTSWKSYGYGLEDIDAQGCTYFCVCV